MAIGNDRQEASVLKSLITAVAVVLVAVIFAGTSACIVGKQQEAIVAQQAIQKGLCQAEGHRDGIAYTWSACQ